MTHLRCPPKKPRWVPRDWLQQQPLTRIFEIAEFPTTLLAYAPDLTEDQRAEVLELARQVQRSWVGDV